MKISSTSGTVTVLTPYILYLYILTFLTWNFSFFIWKNNKKWEPGEIVRRGELTWAETGTCQTESLSSARREDRPLRQVYARSRRTIQEGFCKYLGRNTLFLSLRDAGLCADSHRFNNFIIITYQVYPYWQIGVLTSSPAAISRRNPSKCL